jgi:hypothetical protein
VKILLLTFYYSPDLCAGSFRNTAFAETLSQKLSSEDIIHVVTTIPNRYKTYIEKTPLHEIQGNLLIDRITIPLHQSGFIDQVMSFIRYFFAALKLVRKNEYDIIYASSSRLFTAFLGAVIARSKRKPLYLDIRDLFVDTITEVVKNKVFARLLKILLKPIESFTFRSAQHINMVSPGFKDYLTRFNVLSFSYYTNGIDSEFLVQRSQQFAIKKTSNGVRTIMYAGNIGEGQGLEKIIPGAAKNLSDKYKFIIIGDGGTKGRLEEKIKELKLENVILKPPVNRKQLMELYASADYFFLHLNDYEAFNKVLPSKIFEYAALDKPIIAGVNGTARNFMESHVPNVVLFNPGDVSSLVAKLNTTTYTIIPRDEFCEAFSREHIMNKMAESFLMLKK